MPGRNKLPRQDSLKSRREIERLLRHGQRYRGSYFTVVWEYSDSFRYAVLVSGKVKKAVERNRIKRLCREAVRLNRQVLKRTITVALLPIPRENEPDSTDIFNDIAGAFRHIADQSN